MRLVANWKQAWKWFSIHCMVIAGAIQGTWATLPDEMKATVHPCLVHYLTMAVLALGILGRLVHQDCGEQQ